MRDDQEKCDRTTWLFSDSGNTAAVSLFEHEKIKTESNSKSHRLSVIENCSLVIKKVTDEDVGRYTCRLFNESGQQQGSDSVVDVSVVTSEDAITTSKSTITETTVTVTNKKTTTNKRNPTKAEGEDAATTRKSSTMESTTMMANNLTPTNSSQTNISDSKTNQVWLLWIVIVTVSLAVLLITVVVWKKTKGKKTPKNENVTDPEDGVCYASISYSKKKKSKAQSRGNNDEGDTVTYSTVKASSSSGGVSTDPTVTYAAINKPKK
ncbi:hypothetical protein Q8A73_018172 [Channa argus]|nr:hypothetical protein Q8A73_018172 [Channa argus]